ncbi:hypothetical protein M8C21_003463, partial [Ambrosia artemisiifolia]
ALLLKYLQTKTSNEKANKTVFSPNVILIGDLRSRGSCFNRDDDKTSNSEFLSTPSSVHQAETPQIVAQELEVVPTISIKIPISFNINLESDQSKAGAPSLTPPPPLPSRRAAWCSRYNLRFNRILGLYDLFEAILGFQQINQSTKYHVAIESYSVPKINSEILLSFLHHYDKPLTEALSIKKLNVRRFEVVDEYLNVSHTFNFLQLGLVRPGTAHVAGQVTDHYQLNCLYILKLTVGDGQYHHTMPLLQLHTLRKIENTSQVVNRNQMTDYIGKFEDVDNVVTEGDNGFMLAKLQDISRTTIALIEIVNQGKLVSYEIISTYCQKTRSCGIERVGARVEVVDVNGYQALSGEGDNNGGRVLVLLKIASMRGGYNISFGLTSNALYNYNKTRRHFYSSIYKTRLAMNRPIRFVICLIFIVKSNLTRLKHDQFVAKEYATARASTTSGTIIIVFSPNVILIGDLQCRGSCFN